MPLQMPSLAKSMHLRIKTENHTTSAMAFATRISIHISLSLSLQPRYDCGMESHTNTNANANTNTRTHPCCIVFAIFRGPQSFAVCCRSSVQLCTRTIRLLVSVHVNLVDNGFCCARQLVKRFQREGVSCLVRGCDSARKASLRELSMQSLWSGIHNPPPCLFDWEHPTDQQVKRPWHWHWH